MKLKRDLCSILFATLIGTYNFACQTEQKDHILVDYSEQDLSGQDFSKKDYSGSNFSGSNLRVTKFSRSKLAGTDLSRSDLSAADLSGADLRGADLRFTSLDGADLRYTKLGGANLTNSNYGRFTIWPKVGSIESFKEYQELVKYLEDKDVVGLPHGPYAIHPNTSRMIFLVEENQLNSEHNGSYH